MVSNFVWFFIFLFSLCVKSLQTQKPETLKCECGKVDDFVPRIVGGRNIDPDQHPWMAAILHNGTAYCGGTLINDRYVLTAGHCIKFTKTKYLSVLLGVGDDLLTELQYESVKNPEIEHAFVHENFSSNYLYDKEDIALIKLKHPVEFTPNIKPICLPKKGNDYGGEKATVVGWGKLSEETEESSPTLMQVILTVLKNEDCRKNPTVGEEIVDNFLCAYEDNSDACQGDSGGPLIYQSPTGKMEQIGIVSWGLGCARPNVPGVYTRITSYLEWIHLHTKGASYCETPE